MTYSNFSRLNRWRRESARAFARAIQKFEAGQKEEAEKDFDFMLWLEKKAGSLLEEKGE